MKRILILSFLTFVSSSNQAISQIYNWQPTNGPECGRMYEIYVYDSQILLATPWSNKDLYRSTNGGTTWIWTTTLPEYTNTFVRHRSGIALLGSSVGYIYRSTDRGIAWVKGGAVPGGLTSFCVDSGGTVYAGIIIAGGSAVYKSTDVGLTWALTSLTATGQVTRLAVTSTGAILVATSQGMHRSTDGGTTWKQANAGLTTTNVSGIAVTPNLVFISTLGGGVFRSDDYGNTWTQKATGLPSFYIYDVVVGTFGSLYAAGSTAVFRSVDNGSSWGVQGNLGLPVNSTRLSATSAGTLFSYGCELGILRSTDFGNNWTPSHSGIKAGTVTTLASNSVGHVFASSGPIFRTTDLGATWTQVGPHTLLVTSMAAGGTSMMYAGTSTGVYRSTDNGSTWQTTPITLQSIVATGPGNTVYAGNSLAIFRSTSAGVTWDSANTGLPRGTYRAISISPNGTVYASISTKGLFRSTDNGASWTQTSLSVEAAALLCASDNVLYAASNISTGGVYRSMDRGNSWQKLTSGLPGSYATSVAMNPSGTIFAGFQWNGVYKSTNDGASWSVSSQGLPTSSGFSLLGLSSGALMVGLSGAPVHYSVPFYPPPAPLSAYSFKTLVYAGSARIGQFKDSVLVISNIGNDSLRISNIVSSNPAFSAQYTSATIGPAGSFNNRIRFTPTVAGLTSGVILVSSNAATSPDTIHVSGVGGGQSTVVLGATSISFGNTKVGQYKDAQLTMLNTGNDTLLIQSITSTNALFSARPMSKTVPPGMSFVDTIRFAPTSVGYESGTLQIISNAITSPDSVLLTGVGTGVASIASSLAIVSFGTVPIGQYRDTLVTFSNVGNDTLKITEITSSHPAFSARPTSKVIPPGLIFTDTVRFAPTAAGGVSGVIVITSNATTSPDTIRVSGDGVVVPTGIAEEAIPEKFELSQNYPNPFNPLTAIRYGLPMEAYVSLKVFNTLGQVVATLVEGRRQAGVHTVTWNARVPSGVYFYRLMAEEYVETKQMLLLK